MKIQHITSGYGEIAYMTIKTYNHSCFLGAELCDIRLLGAESATARSTAEQPPHPAMRRSRIVQGRLLLGQRRAEQRSQLSALKCDNSE